MNTIALPRNEDLSYAQYRLRLGQLHVGLWVIVSLALLVSGVAKTFFPVEATPVAYNIAFLTFCYLAYALVAFPFDILGGHILPNRYGRCSSSPQKFAGSLLRGLVSQGFVFVLSGTLIMFSSKLAGFIGALCAVILLVALLTVMQKYLARITGGMSPDSSSRGKSPEVWQNEDIGFTGGVFGWPGYESFVVPARWLAAFTAEELSVIHARRNWHVVSGQRSAGLLLAGCWTVCGFIFASLLTGTNLASPAAFIEFIAYNTLWCFLGLLVLPSVSKAAVFAADAHVYPESPSLLPDIIGRLDTFQDDEPSRQAIVETIFHPLPNVNTRLRSLQEPAASGGPWHVARNALFLSWATFGLLSRAVHCNCGRPELWVFPPAD